MEQFNLSKWNADLMRTVSQSQQFFRFRPTNETFETLPLVASDRTTMRLETAAKTKAASFQA